MANIWKQVSLFLLLGWLAVSTPAPGQTYPSPLPPIERDVCIIGGGSAGTYTAVRLKDSGKSVVVVESQDRLGGHTQTYIDPVTHIPIDYGVLVFHELPLVRNYFARFNISLTTLPSDNLPTGYFDFNTGKVVQFAAADPTPAFEALAAQLLQYPYLSLGYFLPDQVPADLLMPFGDFAKKYGLEAGLQFIFTIAQGFGDLLKHPTIYALKVFGLDLIRTLQTGFLTTALHDNSLLYDAALAELKEDVLLNSYVVSTNRGWNGQVQVVANTPAGKQVIHAKKLVITVPPKLDALSGFDLDATERSIFGQFVNSAYYTGLLRNSSLPDDMTLSNANQNTFANLPVLPGVYTFRPTGVPGLHDFKFGSETVLSDQQVKTSIAHTIQLLRDSGAAPNAQPDQLEYAAFSGHNPFALRVGPKAIAGGFYRRLNALQGRHHTFYTGATFETQDSSLIWNFTESVVLPQLLA